MFLNYRLGTAARVAMLVALGAVGAACSSASNGTTDAGPTHPTDVSADTQQQPQTDVPVASDVPASDVPSTMDAPTNSDAAEADNGDVMLLPGQCRSNADCTGNELGMFVCDIPTHTCRACSPTPDSCAASQHCDPVMYICTAGCHDDTGCSDSSGGHDGGATSLHCDTTMHVCVQCSMDSQCVTGQLCVMNMCVTGCDATHPCPGSQTCCSNTCADLGSSAANCGTCGNTCMIANGMGACSAGTCAVGGCSPGFADCNHAEADGCETNTNTSANNCGTCGNVCPTPPNATPNCAMGACGYTCTAGFADCDGVASNGCEVNLQTDPLHCGLCTTLCNPPHATAACAAGTCSIGSCAPGFADCDGNPTDGCEVNTTTDPLNCSACGTACPTAPNAFPGCVGSTCVISCVAGFQDCTGSPLAGCTTNTVMDPNNCGGCGDVCSIPHATAACIGSVCGVGTCNPGFADCDHVASNGCEINTNSDVGNCGACGMMCTTAGGTPVCSMGVCGVGTCAAGFAHCAATGTACETNTSNDPNNCGGCGDVCSLPHATAVCTSSACAIGTCDPGWADCNHLASDGCEANINTDNGNCGACGAVCAPAHAAAGACILGSCTIAACSAGFADCDGSPTNGCEINITNSAANCGGCGQACPTGAACQGSVCTFYPSTGAEGAFAPTANTTLAAGLHNFTTINIPSTVTVITNGNGILDLRATGNITVAGTITVAGGGGGSSSPVGCNCGNGGATGTTVGGTTSGTPGSVTPTACLAGGGGGGSPGSAGTTNVPCPGGQGGLYGGGAGGYGGGGGGGGGYSGGVGGFSDPGANGGPAGGTEAGGGGTNYGSVVAPTGGTISNACYAGTYGTAGVNRDNTGSAGGGGSIGALATNDLAVNTTFRTGSGGGGGGGGAEDSVPPSNCGDGETGGGGGGGGGGAIRLATTTSIVVSGSVLANGGNGGSAAPAPDDCQDDTGQSGGGGSGGLVFLYSPAITLSGHVSAVGGTGGTVTAGTCGVVGTSTGGTGGLGRIRISVDNITPGACALGGAINPPVAGTACAANNAPCQAYLAQYPN